MDEHRRKEGGRTRLQHEVQAGNVQRILTGETTLAETQSRPRASGARRTRFVKSSGRSARRLRCAIQRFARCAN